jgi:5-(carboxyamino)imidazole ribonucleotide synthase
MEPVPPGGRLGIIGGGQLGRMIALAAAELGLKCHVYCPDADSPAFDVAAERTRAAYEDEAALEKFAASVDVVTYEFENVPRRTAEVVAARARLHPGAAALATTQDRLAEKSFVAELGIETAPFHAVEGPRDLADGLARLGHPAVLKTRRFGYDGKGQTMLRHPGAAPEAGLAEPEAGLAAPEAILAAPEAILAALGGGPWLLEGFVPFTREISVVAARGADGAFAAYEPCANEHRDHILAVTRVPAPDLDPATAAEAVEVARRIGEALGYVGVFAVEMFLVARGGRERVVVNEIAPRVHNSGHWTIEGAQTSQFAQHVRAVCGWPLGATARVGGAAVTMENLIGADAQNWRAIAAEPGAHLHLYGKATAKPGRKMGHVTRLGAARSDPPA